MALGFSKHLYLAGACIAAIASTTAAAQSASNAPSPDAQSDTGNVEDIIVTAQRKDERLQDVPISVTAVTATALANRGITGLNAIDLPQFTPGLLAPQINSRPSYFLRGIGSNAGNANNEPSVAVYIDGVFSPNPMANSFDFNNIERVEILKGPQGTLFGRNATGGVIQIITMDPNLNKTVMKADMSYGNYRTVSTNFYASTPLSNTLAIDLSVHYEDRGKGFGHNYATGMDIQKGESFGIRSKILWEPSDRTTFRLSGIYSYRNHSGYPSANAVASIATLPSVYDLNSNLQPITKSVYENVTLHIDHNLDFARFVSISAWQYAIQRQRQDLDFTPADAAGLDVFQHTRTLSQELQLLSPTGSKLDWTLGAFLYDTTSNGKPSILYTPTANNAITTFTPTRSASVYGQATYEVLPRLKATAGVRWTTEKQKIYGSILNRLTGVTSVVPTQQQSFQKVTWRGSLDYAFSKDIHAYVSANRGTKSGGFVLVNPAAPGYAPEVLDAYEVGVKSELFDHHVRLNIAGFYYNYKNVQVTSTVNQNGTVVTVINNAAAAHLKGIDADFEVRPVSNLSITGGFVVLDSHYTNYQNALAFNAARTATGPFVAGQIYNGSPIVAIPGGAFSLNATGNELAYNAKFTGNLAATYTIPSSIGRFRISGNVFYSASYHPDPDNRIVIPSRTVANASVGWMNRSGRFGLEAWVKNLTDLRYVTYLDEGAVGDNAAYAPPRTYGMTARVSF